MLASDGQESFVIMKYDNITWTDSQLKNDSTVVAWVGFSAGDGQYTSVTEYISVSVNDLMSGSNINQSGVWIFQVDGETAVSGGEYPLWE